MILERRQQTNVLIESGFCGKMRIGPQRRARIPRSTLT